MNVVFLVIPYQLLAVTPVSGTGAVFQHLAVDVADGIQSHFRRRQVGLSDVQVKHVHTALLGGIGQRSELTDGRSGHLCPADGYDWHILFS